MTTPPPARTPDALPGLTLTRVAHVRVELDPVRLPAAVVYDLYALD